MPGTTEPTETRRVSILTSLKKHLHETGEALRALDQVTVLADDGGLRLPWGEPRPEPSNAATSS